MSDELPRRRPFVAPPAASRLPIRRIAITAPPDGWFHGIAAALFRLYRDALLRLGLDVFEVPVDAFLPPDVGRIARLRADLEIFRPELAVGLPHGSYALVCRLPPERDGWRPNFFTDLLDLPTLCLWDHAPLELADQLLAPHPAGPAQSRPGALGALRRALAHPRVVHWSRDSGQTRIMTDLGLALPGQVLHEGAPSLPGFVPEPEHTADAGVGFVGHLYQDEPEPPERALADLSGTAIEEWQLGPGQALWDVLSRQIAALPPQARQSLALDPDQTYYWRFVHRVIVHRAQTASRLGLLASLPGPVSCYGNLRATPGGNLVAIPAPIPFGPALAAVLARHAITVDVLNPGFVHGYSHKPVLGFAAGGFVLLDRKQDFVRNFGAAGEAVSYSGSAELAAKVEDFLARPRYRREVGDAIRERIRERFGLGDVLLRVLESAAFRSATAGAPVLQRRATRSSVTVRSLLHAIRSDPNWLGARAERADRGVRIWTSPRAWEYAAMVPTGPEPGALREPHLRLRLRVETGAIGIARLEDGELVGEQQASAGGGDLVMTVELPRRERAVVILRNTRSGESRVLLTEADLCDRSG